jgi:hypothetical protein
MVTMLWVLAGVGLFAFAMDMAAFEESGSTQNPYFPLFAIYVSLWSVNFSAGWARLQIVYQYDWDVLEYEDSHEDRTDFVQNTRTYKRLNRVSNKEEYYPDPLFRVLALVATFFVLALLILLTIFVAVLCEILKTQVSLFFSLCVCWCVCCFVWQCVSAAATCCRVAVCCRATSHHDISDSHS